MFSNYTNDSNHTQQNSTQNIESALSNRYIAYADTAAVARALLENKEIQNAEQKVHAVFTIIKEKGSFTNLDSVFYEAMIKYSHLLNAEEIALIAVSIVTRTGFDKYHPDLKLLVDFINANTIKHLLWLMEDMPKLEDTLLKSRTSEVFAKMFSLLTNPHIQYAEAPNADYRNYIIDIIKAEYKETSPSFCLDVFAKLAPYMSAPEKDVVFNYVVNKFKNNDRFCMFNDFIEFIKSFSDLSDQNKENVIFAILHKLDSYSPEYKMKIYHSIVNLTTWLPADLLETVVNKCIDKLNKKLFLSDEEKQVKKDLITAAELAKITQFPQDVLSVALDYAKEDAGFRISSNALSMG